MKSIRLLRGLRSPVNFLITSILLFFVAGNANAVLLGLVPDPFPDAKARNSINYYYTNGNDDTGGFTMEIRGLITGIDDSVGLNNVSGSCFSLGCYTLDASFTQAGDFSAGTISLTGTAPSSTVLANSGTLVSGTLTDFGWGGFNQSGLFEFKYDFDGLGGDFVGDGINQPWGPATNGGTIIDTRELAFGADFMGTCNGGNQSDCYDLGDWDTSGLMTREFSTAQSPGNFLSGLTTSDTFVPVPAAVWLFGSAIGFLGFMRRRAQPAG